MSVTGIDQARDAIAYASTHYTKHSLHWALSRVRRFPSRVAPSMSSSLRGDRDLQDWPHLIAEARRVLHDEGVFIVSTPNKAVYAESRENAGPNPFHEHEFELDEFTSALKLMFTNVTVCCRIMVNVYCLNPSPRGAPKRNSREPVTHPTPASISPFAPWLRSTFLPSSSCRSGKRSTRRQHHIRQLESELPPRMNGLNRRTSNTPNWSTFTRNRPMNSAQATRGPKN